MCGIHRQIVWRIADIATAMRELQLSYIQSERSAKHLLSVAHHHFSGKPFSAATKADKERWLLDKCGQARLKHKFKQACLWLSRPSSAQISTSKASPSSLNQTFALAMHLGWALESNLFPSGDLPWTWMNLARKSFQNLFHLLQKLSNVFAVFTLDCIILARSSL